MSKIIGWTIAVFLIITLVFFVSLLVGFLKALGTIALSIIFAGLILLSVNLITEDK